MLRTRLYLQTRHEFALGRTFGGRGLRALLCVAHPKPRNRMPYEHRGWNPACAIDENCFREWSENHPAICAMASGARQRSTTKKFLLLLRLRWQAQRQRPIRQ